MDVKSISRQSLTVPQLVKAQVGSSRISLPVNGNIIYTNLKHISGFGGVKNQPSYSLSQLRTLDNLIDRLKIMKGDKFKPNRAGEGSGEDLEKLIETYRKELYDALHEKKKLYSARFSTSGLSLNVLV
ncbi:MAG: hypothetical protein JEZ04_14595 [Spirochaetales bacterium]|nr:hypothetical protein [Spirochaetales bacterium]